MILFNVHACHKKTAEIIISNTLNDEKEVIKSFYNNRKK